MNAAPDFATAEEIARAHRVQRVQVWQAVVWLRIEPAYGDGAAAHFSAADVDRILNRIAKRVGK